MALNAKISPKMVNPRDTASESRKRRKFDMKLYLGMAARTIVEANPQDMLCMPLGD